jgi:hypothetical protein
MANIVANVGIDKKEAAFRMELSRLHETVVDLKMQLASTKADLNNQSHDENGENVQGNMSSKERKEENSKLAKALNTRVQALSKELITAETKNKKLLRMLESTKKQAKREERRKKKELAKALTQKNKSGKRAENKENNHHNSGSQKDRLMGKKPIKEVTVLRWKPPPKQEKHVRLVENDAKGLGSKLNFEGVSDESFQKAGTGKSVLDSLPNDVLQDVLLQYWHANHESKSTRASAANGAKEQPAPVAAEMEGFPTSNEHHDTVSSGSTTHYESKYEEPAPEGQEEVSYPDANGIMYTAAEWAEYNGNQAEENVVHGYETDTIGTVVGVAGENYQAYEPESWSEQHGQENVEHWEEDGVDDSVAYENQGGYASEYYDTPLYETKEAESGTGEELHQEDLSSQFASVESEALDSFSIEVNGETFHMNDEWREWSERQHEHQPQYSVKEWFEWGAQHYYFGEAEEAEDLNNSDHQWEQEDVEESNSDEKAIGNLFSLCRNGRFGKVKDSILRGYIEVNARDSSRSTLLIVAAQSNNRKAVKFLLKSEADPNLLDSKGKNALYYALKFGYRSISKLLIDAGSDATVDMKPRPRVVDRLLPPHLRGSKLKFRKK